MQHGDLNPPRPCFLAVRPADCWEGTRAALAPLSIDLDFTQPIDYRPTNHPLPDIRDVVAVVITSVRSVASIADISRISNLPVYAVGQKIGALLKNRGASAPFQTAPTIADLMPHLSKIPPGPLLYIRGDQVRDDLSALNRPIINHIAYVSVPRTPLDPALLDRMKKGLYTGILFFSPAQAAQFCTQVNESVGDVRLPDLSAFCLSPAVLECTHSLQWARTVVAATPDISGMVDAVRAFLAQKEGRTP